MIYEKDVRKGGHCFRTAAFVRKKVQKFVVGWQSLFGENGAWEQAAPALRLVLFFQRSAGQRMSCATGA